MNEKNDNYGDIFQQKSKYLRNKMPFHSLDWENEPSKYKTYPNCIKKIQLPRPIFDEHVKFWNVIINRQSMRNFSIKPISINDLSLLLFGMYGLTRAYPKFAYRTVPSAGGLYSIEIYPVINNVEGVEEGLYHYNIREHALECLKLGNFRKELEKGCLDQKMASKSAINFIWTSIIERLKWKYLQRCYRYMYMDVGHIGQNFYLIAEALGFAACTIGALYDDELNDFLEIDGVNETTIYVGVVGKKFERRP